MGSDQEWQPKPVELFWRTEEKRVARFYQRSFLGLVISKKISHSKEVSVYFDAATLEKKIKIIIKKKDYPLAVTRNKAKRWVREIFRSCGYGPGFVVVIRKGFLDLGFREFHDIVKIDLVKFEQPSTMGD